MSIAKSSSTVSLRLWLCCQIAKRLSARGNGRRQRREAETRRPYRRARPARHCPAAGPSAKFGRRMRRGG